jgi:ribosomal protein S3
MGQKTNPNILRISKTCNWKSKYTEKKPSEFSLYVNHDIEIQKFVVKFFKDSGLTVQSCNLNYSNDILNLYITYHQNFDSLFLITKINKAQKINFVKNKYGVNNNRSTFLKNIKNYHEYESVYYKKILTKTTCKFLSKKNTPLMKRLKLLNYYKKYLQLKNNYNVYEITSNPFLSKLFEGISLFLNKTIKVNLILRPLNKDIQRNLTKKQHTLLKKKLVKLRKYQKNEFFKEGVNLAFLSTNSRNSADLIANFISTNLRKLKRHNFFLKFIKSTFTTFISKTFSSKIYGIKIKVKGRFNGAPRAKSRMINIGKDMPVLTLKSKINYSETTAYTLNGTFGVKVWVYEK